jgi:hypothetical protein
MKFEGPYEILLALKPNSSTIPLASETSGVQLVDLRSANRYNLTAPVTFAWKGPGGYPLLGKGVTRDVSVAGVFVLTRACPPRDVAVSLEIDFPSFRLGQHILKFVIEGQVVRINHTSHDEQGNGFAVRTYGLAIPEGGPVS